MGTRNRNAARRAQAFEGHGRASAKSPWQAIDRTTTNPIMRSREDLGCAVIFVPRLR